MKRHKVVMVCLLLLLLASTLAHAKIVFDSERNGIDGVYVIDDDGSNQTLLTDEFRAHSPSWSPDGRQIVFTTAYLINILMTYVCKQYKT